MNALCPEFAPVMIARVKRPARALVLSDLPEYRESTLAAVERFLAEALQTSTAAH